MNNRFVLLLFSVLIGANVVAQEPEDGITEELVREIAATENEATLVKEASAFMQEGYLYFSEILVDKLLEYNSESPNYNYRKGFLMLKIRKDYLGAKKYLEKAIVDVDPNYDAYSPREKRAPTDAFYHLGKCYHLDEDVTKAHEMYSKFIEVSKSTSELIPVAKMNLQQCNVARYAMNNPKEVYLKNIGPAINTDMPEYSPVISLDGGSLYFTSRREWPNKETAAMRDPAINQYPEDIYVSYLNFEDSSWTTPEKLDFCQPRRNEATIAISSDERKIYVYMDSTGFGDIYYTDFYHAKFNKIEAMTIPKLNTEHWETHSMMTHDQKSLYFVSDRPGGYGGRDIYVVHRKENGSWSEPMNLGPKINGPFDEDSPFISIDNKTLYYATNGEKSMGGFDIMRSDLQSDGSWSEGMNLGYPINSTNDDAFYTTTIDGRRGYMTSFRAGGYGEKDIYEIYNDYLGVKDLAVLKGVVKTVDDKPIPEDFAINVKLVCVDCDESANNKLVYPRLRDGIFMTGLEPCKTYRLEYKNVTDELDMGNESFTTLCDTAYQEIYKELLLDVDKKMIIFPEDTLELDTVAVSSFNNLEFMHYFAYNKNKLNVKRGKLKQFVKDVEDQLNGGREEITINVYSSASHVPTKTYDTNEKLTKLRAENMKYDLIQHFENDEKYKGRVNVVIVTAIVQGPDYTGDYRDKEKYFPYQYVGLKTE
ncbi:MAG: hypothetical protein ACO2Z9_06735 [Crocinitomicaceae bacterium]